MCFTQTHKWKFQTFFLNILTHGCRKQFQSIIAQEINPRKRTLSRSQRIFHVISFPTVQTTFRTPNDRSAPCKLHMITINTLTEKKSQLWIILKCSVNWMVFALGVHRQAFCFWDSPCNRVITFLLHYTIEFNVNEHSTYHCVPWEARHTQVHML